MSGVTHSGSRAASQRSVRFSAALSSVSLTRVWVPAGAGLRVGAPGASAAAGARGAMRGAAVMTGPPAGRVLGTLAPAHTGPAHGSLTTQDPCQPDPDAAAPANPQSRQALV